MPTLEKTLIYFLMMFLLVSSSLLGSAQPPPPVFARITMQKVYPGKEQEYLKFIRETMKPIHTARRTNGKIVHWILFKVHFTGADDPYNYVAVTYYPSWSNTEESGSFTDLIKQADPKADPVAIAAKGLALRSIVSHAIVYRVDAVEPPAPLPFKYIRLDYMKVKPEMNAEYLKVEREDWIPFHKMSIDNGESTAWGLWQFLFPSGTGADYDFVTSSRYSSYSQIMEVDYEKTFKKASPAKDINAIFDRTTKSRDLVKSELWEVIDMLN